MVEYLSFQKKQPTPKTEFYNFMYNQNSNQCSRGLSKND